MRARSSHRIADTLPHSMLITERNSGAFIQYPVTHRSRSRTKPWKSLPKRGPANGGSMAGGVGGGSVGDGHALHPDAELVYVGTGNGLPWPQEIRQGKGSQRLDNLYITSILAIDIDSGQLKWHYQ